MGSIFYSPCFCCSKNITLTPNAGQCCADVLVRWVAFNLLKINFRTTTHTHTVPLAVWLTSLLPPLFNLHQHTHTCAKAFHTKESFPQAARIANRSAIEYGNRSEYFRNRLSLGQLLITWKLRSHLEVRGRYGKDFGMQVPVVSKKYALRSTLPASLIFTNRAGGTNFETHFLSSLLSFAFCCCAFHAQWWTHKLLLHPLAPLTNSTVTHTDT